MNTDDLKSHMLLLRCAIVPRAGGLHPEDELLLLNSGWTLTPLMVLMLKHWPLDCRAECARLVGVLHCHLPAFRALFLSLFPADFDLRLRAAESDGDGLVAFVDASHCTPLLIWNDETRRELHGFVEREHRILRDELLLVDERYADQDWDPTRVARLFHPTALAGEVVVCGVYLSAYVLPEAALDTLGLDEQRFVEKILARLHETVRCLGEHDVAPSNYSGLLHAPSAEVVSAWTQQQRALHLLCASCVKAVQRRHDLVGGALWEAHFAMLLELLLADARLALGLGSVLPLLSMLLSQDRFARFLGRELHIKPLIDVLLYQDFPELPLVIQLIANALTQCAQCAAQVMECGGLFPLLFALVNDSGDGHAAEPAVCTAAAKLLALLVRSDEYGTQISEHIGMLMSQPFLDALLYRNTSNFVNFLFPTSSTVMGSGAWTAERRLVCANALRSAAAHIGALSCGFLRANDGYVRRLYSQVAEGLPVDVK
jgi:hypothetical protein